MPNLCFVPNRNGDEPATLAREFCDLMDAIDAVAAKAAALSALHGRNYQTTAAPAGLRSQDVKARGDHLAALHAFRAWAEAGAEKASDAM